MASSDVVGHGVPWPRLRHHALCGMACVFIGAVVGPSRGYETAEAALRNSAPWLATEGITSEKFTVFAAVPSDAGFPTPRGACPEEMVEVAGGYCPEIEQRCLRWLDGGARAFPRRCAEFAPSGKCKTKEVSKHFCIDKFEYPNRPGTEPVVMTTWYAARDACVKQKKRLCGDSEWTLACEGRERLPYPYGLTRSAKACNIDKPHPPVNERALLNRRTQAAEVARLWQGEPSGARPGCGSPFGVFDMTGNVDEWVVNERKVPFQSGLKGGYWGPVRDRCRPMTKVHSEVFSYYQVGFRCCADAP